MTIYNIIQPLYIIYILNYFKTKYSIAHPITLFNNTLLYHPIGISTISESKVCKLGNILSWFLATFVFVRNNYNLKYSKSITKIVLIITIILSMLNFNVVLYLIPHFIFEIKYILE